MNFSPAAPLLAGFALVACLELLALLPSSEASPCSETIRYSIADIDERFAMDRKTVAAAARRAAALWNTAAGRILLQEALPEDSKPAKLPVALIFNERQEKLQSALYEKQSLEVLRERLQKKLLDLAQEFSRLNARIDQYNLAVQNFKAKASQELAGGSTSIAELQAEEEAQRQALVELKQRAQTLQQQRAKHEAEVTALNTQVARYQQEYQDLRQPHAAAEYRRHGQEQKITVWVISGLPALVRVLAHEFGHALGLDHVSADAAVMNALSPDENRDRMPTLQAADLAALRQLCGAGQQKSR